MMEQNSICVQILMFSLIFLDVQNYGKSCQHSSYSFVLFFETMFNIDQSKFQKKQITEKVDLLVTSKIKNTFSHCQCLNEM